LFLTRSPLVHFLLLGVVMFAARGWLASGPGSADTEAFRIALDSARLAEMEKSFSDQMGRGPGPEELDRMIEAEVDEEILYREALARGLLQRDGGVQTRLIQKMHFLEGKSEIEDAPALLARAVELGLHQDDIVVRRILVQKMRLLGSMLDASQQPSPDEIADAYALQRERLREPDRRSFFHVFLSADRRPEHALADATALRGRLEEGRTPPDAAISLGDPFPLGHRIEHRSRRDLDRTFGPRFGDQAFDAPPRRWSAPVTSAYGQHLLFVDAVEPGQTPPLESVADRLRRGLTQQRRDKKLEALLSGLRTRYEVVLPKTQEAG
jgi:hypothetical protein